MPPANAADDMVFTQYYQCYALPRELGRWAVVLVEGLDKYQTPLAIPPQSAVVSNGPFNKPAWFLAATIQQIKGARNVS